VPPPDIDIRPAVAADRADILDLLVASLGWVPDEQHASFFRWKHDENPFGPSYGWVAVDGERLAGFRTFLRWEFVRGGETMRAVRAVDTATHPDYQGQGIFSRLTMRALGTCESEGIAFVFNTPNDQSRPGYLKMGWQVVGRLPALVRFRSPTSLVRSARSRVPADKWSVPCPAGEPAGDVFADQAAAERLLARLDPVPGLATRYSAAYLAWRYGFPGLAYRVLPLGDSLEDGAVVVRTRRRGRTLELAVDDVLAPSASRARVSACIGSALRLSEADYAIRIGRWTAPRAGFVPFLRQGPIFTWRAVTEHTMPEGPAWSLRLGDIELF
jgi:GNAT superfamily N-acetyltransferase